MRPNLRAVILKSLGIGEKTFTRHEPARLGLHLSCNGRLKLFRLRPSRMGAWFHPQQRSDR